MASDVKKNPYSYLEHLDLKNKTRKIREEEEQKKNGHVIKREENFHLFFNGANDIRIRNSRKRSELEQSKSPAARKQWSNNAQKAAQRRRWDHPETPVMLKEYKEIPEQFSDPHKELFDKPESHMTKSTFKVAGNHLIRPASKKDCNSLVHRIENLNSPQKDQILKMLELLESENNS